MKNKIWLILFVLFFLVKNINGLTVDTKSNGASLSNMNASNLTTGTVPSGRMTGPYTGITGVGTLTTGTWNASVIPVSYGGTSTTTLNGYVYGNGTSAFTASSVIPTSNLSGVISVSNGGTGTTTLNGVVIGNGTSAFTTVVAPSGAIVGTSDAQTLTNKTMSGASNTFSAIPTSSLTGVINVAGGGTGLATITGYVKGTGTANLSTSATIPTSDLNGVLSVANGGTNASSAGITAFNNITGYTASGATGTTSTNLCFSTSPSLTTPILGTPQSGNLSNCTALSLTSGVSGTLPVANGGTNASTFTAGSVVFAGTSGTYTQNNSNLFWDNTNTKLGIGTTTPTFNLEVRQDVNGLGPTVFINNSAGNAGTTARLLFENGGTTNRAAIIGGRQGSGNGYLDLQTGSTLTSRLYIDQNGNLGVSTSNPIYVLDVNGTAAIRSLSSQAGTAVVAAADGKLGLVVSDESQKEHIVPFEYSLDIYNFPSVFEYDYKNGGGHTFGMMAQEVEKVNPVFVNYDSEDKVRSIKTIELIYPVIECLKNQKKKIDELEHRLKLLEESFK